MSSRNSSLFMFGAMLVVSIFLFSCGNNTGGRGRTVEYADSIVDAYENNRTTDHVRAYKDMNHAIDIYGDKYPVKKAEAQVFKGLMLFVMGMNDETKEELSQAEPYIGSLRPNVQTDYFRLRATLATDVDKDYGKAEALMKKAIEISLKHGNSYVASVDIGNLAEIYVNCKDYAGALAQLKRIDEIARKTKIPSGYLTQYYYVKGMTDYYTGHLDSAYANFGRCHAASSKLNLLNLQASAMRYASDIDSIRQDYHSFYYHYRTYVKLNEQLAGAQTVSKISTMKEQTAIKSLNESYRRHNLIMWAVIIIGVIVLISTLLIFYFIVRRNKAMRKLSIMEQEQMKNKMQISNMEKELLELRLKNENNQLEKANKKNLSMSLQLASLNDGSQKEKSDAIQPLTNIIEQIPGDFVRKIEKLFPTISKTELRLACYIKLKMNVDEITRVMHISSTSFYTLRYRLRKRLGLGKNDSLENFIDSIE